MQGNGLKAVKVTFKEDEKWLHDFIFEHSSPSAFLKDIAKQVAKDELEKRSSNIQRTVDKQLNHSPNFFD